MTTPPHSADKTPVTGTDSADPPVDSPERLPSTTPGTTQPLHPAGEPATTDDKTVPETGGSESVNQSTKTSTDADGHSSSQPKVAAFPEAAKDRVTAIIQDEDSALQEALDEAMAGLTSSELTDHAKAPTISEDPTLDSLITGRIANIGSDDVLVDFGTKSLGVMPRAELDPDRNYAVGDPIDVLVTEESAQSGLLSVSHKKAKQETILRNLKVGVELECRVIGMNRGGLEVAIEGLRGFMPSSQVDMHYMKDISNLIGEKIRAEVTQFDPVEPNIVLSRRRVQIREAEEEKEKAFASLAVGETRRGKVRSLADYGAFVDIGGLDGLLHISDMSWGRVNHPQDVISVGDEIEVKIIKVNHEKKKVSLSLKQTLPDPWSMAAPKYPPGTKVHGRIVRLTNFGAFVELEPGLDALLPISEMSWTRRLRHPKEAVKEDDWVDVSVINCDAEKKRITLSLKALSSDPWSTVVERYQVGSKIKGTVVRTTDFGAFVNLEEGIDGLIHISELSENRIRAVTDRVKAGDEVEARVLNIDPQTKKIALSLREPPPEPSPAELAQAQAERAATEKRRSKKRRGGLTVEWDQGLGGLDPSKFAR